MFENNKFCFRLLPYHVETSSRVITEMSDYLGITAYVFLDARVVQWIKAGKSLSEGRDLITAGLVIFT